MFTRGEMCAACHDVTNALPIKNALGKWVGGFPIERTYTEWANSRYADRPGNTYFDPHYKRDCQTCHMQQDYGQPGTAQTLYKDGSPLGPQNDRVASDGAAHLFFTHHFVGGNAYVTHMIGTDVDESGNFPTRCGWKIPAGSADPYSVQFKAIASLGDGCPTLDLVYATALNLVTDGKGLPIDEKGNVVDKSNPGRPQFRDVNNNGDLFDDS